MKAPYAELFNTLLHQVDMCMQLNLAETEKFQNCFWISLRCNKKLKEIVLDKGFLTDQQEIEFFREVKPKFACFVEFFVIASEALWYAASKVENPASFWKSETEKCARFRMRHQAFIRYYESERHDLDKDYFLRLLAEPFVDVSSKIYDESPDFQSRRDWVVRSYLANKMYLWFAEEKLFAANNRRAKKADADDGLIPFTQLLLQSITKPGIQLN